MGVWDKIQSVSLEIDWTRHRVVNIIIQPSPSSTSSLSRTPPPHHKMPVRASKSKPTTKTAPEVEEAPTTNGSTEVLAVANEPTQEVNQVEQMDKPDVIVIEDSAEKPVDDSATNPEEGTPPTANSGQEVAPTEASAAPEKTATESENEVAKSSDEAAGATEQKATEKEADLTAKRKLEEPLETEATKRVKVAEE